MRNMTDILTALRDDNSWMVREAVAKNPNTPPEVVAQMDAMIQTASTSSR